jgi:hypothetical protein
MIICVNNDDDRQLGTDSEFDALNNRAHSTNHDARMRVKTASISRGETA